MGVLSNLKPEGVFKFFEEICGIPHESGNMKAIADYCCKFAEDRKLQCIRDNMDNVIIIKEATAGYENSPAMIIQGHLDMVCAKTPESKIDFAKDGLKVMLDGDKIYADGTSLGGDNGIAIAMALAILDADDLKHPRIEAVFTVDEETGLYGAEAIDVSMLKAKKFLNLDSEDEGIVTVSCAGGVTAECKLPVAREVYEGLQVTLIMDGMLGGHSGVEINKGRGNSNMLMGRLAYEVMKEVPFRIVKMEGGQQDNAITKYTKLEVVISDKDRMAFAQAVEKSAAKIKDEFKTADPGLKVTIQKGEKASLIVLDEDSADRLLACLLNFPNGIVAYSMDIPGLVETSLNLGILKNHDEYISLVSGLRSSIESAKWALADRVTEFMKGFGGSCELVGNYPGWQYKPDSALRDTVVKVYKELTGKEPVVEAIHAGLECGMFSEKIQDLDCVSIGPDLRDVHTVDEWMSLASVQRTWKLVCGILEASK